MTIDQCPNWNSIPLIVKKMLAEEGSYALTEEDEVKCVSIDRLLLAASWNGNDENTSWSRILEAERERGGVSTGVLTSASPGGLGRRY